MIEIAPASGTIRRLNDALYTWLLNYKSQKYVQDGLKATNIDKMGLDRTKYWNYYTHQIFVFNGTTARRLQDETSAVIVEKSISELASVNTDRSLASTGILVRVSTKPHLRVNYTIKIPPSSANYASVNLNLLASQVQNTTYASFEKVLTQNLQTYAVQQNVTYQKITAKTLFIDNGLLEYRPITSTTLQPGTTLQLGSVAVALSRNDSDTATIALSVGFSLLFLAVCCTVMFVCYVKGQGNNNNKKEENNAVVEEVPIPEPVWNEFDVGDGEEGAGIQQVPTRKPRPYQNEPEEPEEPEAPEAPEAPEEPEQGDTARVGDM